MAPASFLDWRAATAALRSDTASSAADNETATTATANIAATGTRQLARNHSRRIMFYCRLSHRLRAVGRVFYPRRTSPSTRHPPLDAPARSLRRHNEKYERVAPFG